MTTHSGDADEAARAWSNSSVLSFARGRDPIEVAQEEARSLHELALDAGAAGPPVDVFQLANALGIALRPRDDLIDAQIRVDTEAAVIEYNPSRPRGRLRFSIAHEIAHSRFADVAESPRHRTASGSVESSSKGDDWELELLCDVIAADLLMPSSSIEGLLNIDPDIDFLMETRRRLDVSTEALLRRIVRSSARPLMLLAASRQEDFASSLVRVDYVDGNRSQGWGLPRLKHGDLIEGSRTLIKCSAVGQTASGTELIAEAEMRVQAVGVPAYPGRRWPRVLALLEPVLAPRAAEGVEYVSSDILDSLDGGAGVLIAHVVPDSTRGWSRFGVGGTLARAFPLSASAYRGWTLADISNRQLGNVHLASPAAGAPAIASIVAQSGHGPSDRPRLNYEALAAGLSKVASAARELDAIVHLPRLGAGQAGGRWDVIQSILVDELVSKGVRVVVHTLPAARRHE